MESTTRPELVWKERQASSKLGLINSIRRAVGLNKLALRDNTSSYTIVEKTDNSETFESYTSHELPLLRRAQMLQ